MKNSIRMLTTAALLTLGLASYGVAQMMGDNHDHSQMNQSDSKSQSGMINMGMMGDMTKQCKMMSDNLGELQEHFDSMMQIDDLNTLKAEMKKHQNMIQEMSENISEHQNMCKSMMSSDSKTGCSMMGNGNKSSSN